MMVGFRLSCNKSLESQVTKVYTSKSAVTLKSAHCALCVERSLAHCFALLGLQDKGMKINWNWNQNSK